MKDQQESVNFFRSCVATIRERLYSGFKLYKLKPNLLAKLLILTVLIFTSISQIQAEDVYPAPSLVICPERFNVTREGSTQKIPYRSNKLLSAVDPTIKQVVIVIHGNSRNANDYYNYIVEAAGTANVTDALIIAPQFLKNDDLKEDFLKEETLYWSSDGWKEGDDSLSSPYERPWTISSFTIVDMLIEHISNKALFPNLKSIVVAGHSAGGQFVNRYAAGNRMEQSLRLSGISCRYICANPSSYLYLDKDRRKPNTIDQFAPLPRATIKQCKDYNTYKYGLEYLNSYMTEVGVRNIRKQNKTRNVVYLLGGADNNPLDKSEDASCAAELQGANRLERGTIFYNYLKHFYNNRVYRHHVKSIVPGIGHDAHLMFNSNPGRFYLFNPS